MKVLSKSKPFYTTALNNFRKQYKDVSELYHLFVDHDKKVCGGTWVDSRGVIGIADSVDISYTVKIVD